MVGKYVCVICYKEAEEMEKNICYYPYNILLT